MNENVMWYLANKEAMIKDKKKEFLIQQGVIEKEYADLVDDPSYPEYDPVARKRYRIKDVDVTDEEFQSIVEAYNAIQNAAPNVDSSEKRILQLQNEVTAIHKWVQFFGILTIVSLIVYTLCIVIGVNAILK